MLAALTDEPHPSRPTGNHSSQAAIGMHTLVVSETRGLALYEMQ